MRKLIYLLFAFATIVACQTEDFADELAEAEATIEQQNDKIAQLQSTINGLIADGNDDAVIIAELNAQVSALNEALATLRDDANVDAETIASLQSQVDALQLELDEAQADLAIAEADLVDANISISDFQDTIAILEAALAEAGTDVDELVEQIGEVVVVTEYITEVVTETIEVEIVNTEVVTVVITNVVTETVEVDVIQIVNNYIDCSVGTTSVATGTWTPANAASDVATFTQTRVVTTTVSYPEGCEKDDEVTTETQSQVINNPAYVEAVVCTEGHAFNGTSFNTLNGLASLPGAGYDDFDSFPATFNVVKTNSDCSTSTVVVTISKSEDTKYRSEGAEDYTHEGNTYLSYDEGDADDVNNDGDTYDLFSYVRTTYTWSADGFSDATTSNNGDKVFIQDVLKPECDDSPIIDVTQTEVSVEYGEWVNVGGPEPANPNEPKTDQLQTRTVTTTTLVVTETSYNECADIEASSETATVVTTDEETQTIEVNNPEYVNNAVQVDGEWYQAAYSQTTETGYTDWELTDDEDNYERLEQDRIVTETQYLPIYEGPFIDATYHYGEWQPVKTQTGKKITFNDVDSEITIVGQDHNYTMNAASFVSYDITVDGVTVDNNTIDSGNSFFFANGVDVWTTYNKSTGVMNVRVDSESNATITITLK